MDLLVLAVLSTLVITQGSTLNSETTQDNSLCDHFTTAECFAENLFNDCPNLCKEDNPLCDKFHPDQCNEKDLYNQCPNMCKNECRDILLPSTCLLIKEKGHCKPGACQKTCNYCKSAIKTTTPAPTSTIPMTTSTTSTTTPTPICPLSQGFFQVPSINACYRHFNDRERTNDEARALCRREGLELARLQDQHALQIRKFIVEYIIGDKTSHIGARGGDDGIIRWDRDQVAVGATNPLWYPGKPGNKVTKTHCLRLMTKRANLEGKSPGTPYWSESCDDLRYTLCEVTYI